MKKRLFAALLLAAMLSGCAFETGGETEGLTDPESLPAVSTAGTTAPETTAPQATELDPVLSLPERLLAGMTLEEKVGQMFLARCPETDGEQDVATYHLGGYVLFDRDFAEKTPDEARDAIARYQNAGKIPMLIAVDEEGGSVTRVSCHAQYREENFPSPRSAYAGGGLARIAELETEKCALLRSLGVNVNLAPVCDVTDAPNAFIYDRSLGESPETTAEFVRTVLQVSRRDGMGAVLKHFPGYGNNDDTHTGIAVDMRTLAELQSRDLIPFAAGIDAGCGAIMVSHTIVSCMDDSVPASLSEEVHAYLRDQMGFSGVIVTDDLAMEAITDLYGEDEAAVCAVLAGNDLLCVSEYAAQYDAVLEAVRSGRISPTRIDESVLRILRWKQEIGLLREA